MIGAMAAYLTITYDISDPEEFAGYNPGRLPEIGATIAAHGGRVLFAGAADYLEGDARHNAVGLEFPDADAARAWLDDPAYAEAKAIRLGSTTEITSFLIEGRG